MTLPFHIQAFFLVSLIYMSMQASGKPVGGQPNLLGSCRFPQSESELRVATQWLINKTFEFPRALQRNAQTTGKQLFVMLDKVQKATPIPVMKYACQSGYHWACTTPDSDGSEQSNGRAGRLRQNKKLMQSQLPFGKLYTSAEGQVRLNTRCEWAHLRPHCVFNSTIFPPILCQTDCRSTCSKKVEKVHISVIAISECEAGQPTWTMTTKHLVPIKYNACGC